MFDPMKKWKRAGVKVKLAVGDMDDFDSPGVTLIALVRDAESAERVLVLVAGDMGLDPIGWKFI